jgi:hypothetical protein
MSRNYYDRRYHDRFEKIREWNRMRELARKAQQEGRQAQPGEVQCQMCGGFHQADRSCGCFDNGCQ